MQIKIRQKKIIVGSYDENGNFNKNENSSTLTVTKGILLAADKKADISKKGFETKDGKQKEGIQIATFISFNTNIELSGLLLLI
jgi:hypothetical protein